MKTRILLLALITLAFALRVYRLDYHSVWVDEGFSVDFASQSLGQMLGMWGMQPDVLKVVAASSISEDALAVAADIHAPFYYLLLHFWTDLTGRTEFALRFLSTILGLLIVPLLYATGKRLFGERVGLLATLFGVLSPFYVAYSQEARMYALSATLSLLSAYLMIRIVGRSANLLHLAAFVIATALGLYTHYFFALIVIFQNIFVLTGVVAEGTGSNVESRKLWQVRIDASVQRLLLRWGLAQVSILLLLSPWLATALRQVRTYNNEATTPPPASVVLQWFWQAINVGVLHKPETISPFLAGLLGAVALAFLLAWKADAMSRQSLILLILYLVVPLAGTIAILQYRPMFHPRYLIAVSPAYYLILAASVRGLARSAFWLPHVSCLAFGIMLVAGLNIYYYDENFFKDDARGVARFLEQNASADDLVVLDYPEPLGYYYHGEAPYAFVPGEPELATEALNKLAARRTNVYHVKWQGAFSDRGGLIPYLVEKEGMRVETKRFVGYEVDRYRMRDGIHHFDLPSNGKKVEANFDRVLQLKDAAYGMSSPEHFSATPVQLTKLWVVLNWELLQETSIEYAAFLHLKDNRGRIVGQSDRLLYNVGSKCTADTWECLDRTLRTGHASTRFWRKGETGQTYHIVALPLGTPPGDYTIELGLYDPTTQQRPSILNDASIPIGASLKLGEIHVAKASSAASAPLKIESGDPNLGVSQSVNADLGPLRLLGYDLPNVKLKAGDNLPLTLLWQALTNVTKDYGFRLEAIGPGGESYSWPPRRPDGGTYPTTGWVSGELVRDRGEYLLPARTAAGEHSLLGQLVEMTTGEEVAAVELGVMQVEERPRLTELPRGAKRVAVRFGDSIELVGFDLRPEIARAGAALELTLYWRALREMDKSYTVFTHLLDSSDRKWAQHDGLPGQGAQPTTSWLSGDLVADKHDLRIDANAAPGEYRMYIGLYEAGSGKRLEAEADGVDLMNDAALIARVILQR